ncbi:MAG: SpoVA/SpoVAEb family sporulation membrane protein [Bacilli bacterium]|nr:SpoVA/SpoVAEb family sporulation membrane protein [Bacilli bacterium]
MINKKYDEIVERHKPTSQRSKNSLIAFLIGGLVGAIGEGLIQIYCSIWHISRTVSSVYMIITLIFIAALATAIGFFDKWVNFARCGLLIPITGFSHSMMSAALEYKREGPIFGIGSNTFKLAGSVIVYGVVSAWTFGLIRLIIGGSLL